MLKKTLSALAVDVCRYEAHFAARRRPAALGAYATVKGLLEAMAKERDKVRANGVVLALLDEHRVDPRGPWSSLLVVLFSPMLLSLRSRLQVRLPRRQDEDEFDQRVLDAFLAALGEGYGAGGRQYICLALRLATWRRIAKTLERDERDPPMVSIDDDIAAAPGASPADVCEAVSELAERSIALAHVPLAHRVRTHLGALPAGDRHRAYERIRKQQYRLTKRSEQLAI